MNLNKDLHNNKAVDDEKMKTKHIITNKQKKITFYLLDRSFFMKVMNLESNKTSFEVS